MPELVTEPISLKDGGGLLLGRDKTASGKTEYQTRSSRSTADEYLDGFFFVLFIRMVKVSTNTRYTSPKKQIEEKEHSCQE